MLKALISRVINKDPRLEQLDKIADGIYTYNQTLKDTEAGRSILEAPLAEQREWALAMIVWLNNHTVSPYSPSAWLRTNAVRDMMFGLLRRKLPYEIDDIIALLEWSAQQGSWGHGAAQIIRVVESYLKDHALTPELKTAVSDLSKTLDGYYGRDNQRSAARLRGLIGDTSVPTLPLPPGDAWAETVLADVQALPAELQAAWSGLFATCLQASGSAPTTKWRKAADPFLSQIGFEDFKAPLLKWFALVNETNPNEIIDPVKSDLLKALAWLCADRDDAELARALTALAVSAYRKLPGIGPRSVSVGNACVWALGHMPGSHGVAQLAVLKVRIKLNNVQKAIQKALNEAAERLNLSPDAVEEMTVPTYGLQEVGLRRESLGEFTAELVVDGTDVVTRWLGPDGNPRASVPQAIKQQHGETQKELTQAAKDIRTMLTAQRARLDTMFLAQKKWEYVAWREHYLDHMLVGPLARRLIWKFSQGDRASSGIWWDGEIAGRDGHPIDWLTPTTQVELWHPLSVDPAIVVAWREWLASHEVQQPFKQAHREIYLLTDAERATRVYSNRFAAHILRQHQFNALCAARGWKNQLRLMVDDTYPPATRVLPQWGLRAEFWVEGAGDHYGTDTNETGTYLYIATDQVRFYSLDAATNYAHAGGGGYAAGRWGTGTPLEPLPLEQIPPLALSEILRDVDLFVGVASVGNDPNWADGGPEGRYQNYWQSYSFGDLSESAKTRHTVLEQLLPHLKIASKCELSDRFLIVKGNLRTYKIHLGSGNILMEPNDQYLCIVPGRGAGSAVGDKLFLPFEGDQTLAIILSKAFLLAEDTKITDPTIVRQIR
jgi:hypothetical protein